MCLKIENDVMNEKNSIWSKGLSTHIQVSSIQNIMQNIQNVMPRIWIFYNNYSRFLY